MLLSYFLWKVMRYLWKVLHYLFEKITQILKKIFYFTTVVTYKKQSDYVTRITCNALPPHSFSSKKIVKNINKFPFKVSLFTRQPYLQRLRATQTRPSPI